MGIDSIAQSNDSNDFPLLFSLRLHHRYQIQFYSSMCYDVQYSTVVTITVVTITVVTITVVTITVVTISRPCECLVYDQFTLAMGRQLWTLLCP